MHKNESEIMEFRKGIKDSVPVGMGYFAVSFSLGIIAKKCRSNTDTRTFD